MLQWLCSCSRTLYECKWNLVSLYSRCAWTYQSLYSLHLWHHHGSLNWQQTSWSVFNKINLICNCCFVACRNSRNSFHLIKNVFIVFMTWFKIYGLERNEVKVVLSMLRSLTNLHLPTDLGFLFSLLRVLWAKNCLIDGFLAKLGSSSGSTSSNSILTPLSSISVSAVFQLNLTIEGNPNTGSMLSRKNFLVTASPGYPDPHSDVISRSSLFLHSGKVHSFKHLSLATC